jgi:hypothetical protein
MKEEKQIEKILESNQVSVMQVPMLHSDDYGKTAKEIASLYEGWYPGEFVEWLAFKSHGNFETKFELHKYWDGTVNEWRATFRKFTGLEWKDITLPDLFKYWKDNVEGK